MALSKNLNLKALIFEYNLLLNLLSTYVSSHPILADPGRLLIKLSWFGCGGLSARIQMVLFAMFRAKEI